MLDQQTKQRINSARQILVGKIPDPKSQVEQITTALIYKFMDDMDRENEEIGGKATFLVGELAEFSWGKLMSKQMSGDERWNLYTRALESFAKSKQIPELFRIIFKSSYLPYRDVQTLNLFLKEINEFSYDQSEKLGDAFEYLLSILGSQGDAGQFRTPRHLIDFIVETVAPQKNEKILDPACGTAGFLISAYKYIKKYNSSNFDPEKDPLPFEYVDGKDVSELSIQSNGRYKGDKLNPDDRKKLAQNIHGYDIAPEMVRLSLVNMYLHGFVTPQIQEYDTLTFDDKWGENFDVILANPPFMTPKGGIRPHKKFSVSANRSEVLFVDYIAEHLTIKGRAGIIVPEGIIFQSANAYKLLRKNLIENWGLYAVVSLPAGVFQPYSGVKTSILFLDREIAKKTDEILFVKVENDGFDLGAQRRKIEKNDLPKAFEILKEWQKEQKFDEKEKIAITVKKEKIAESGDYNLTGDRYREVVDYSNVEWEIFQLKELEENGDITLGRGKVISKEDIAKDPGIYPIYSSSAKGNGEFGKYAKYIFDEELITWSIDGGGRFFYRPKHKFSVTNVSGWIKINNKEKINAKYLYRILTSAWGEKTFNYTAKAHPSVIREIYKIPLPPFEIQKQIVEELDDYQKVIDGAKQVIENWKPNIKIESDWEMVELGEVCEFNPKKAEIKHLKKDTLVSFLPMKYLNERQMYFSKTEERTIEKVYSGYTYFAENDVLLARVTPCFENGKSGIAKSLKNKIGFGSSEYFVYRANTEKVYPKWIYYFISSDKFIKDGKNNMTGTGGLQRLTKDYAVNFKIPLPPLETQKQIVAEIEAEQEIVNQNKKLTEIFEGKIIDKIREIWGE